MVNGKVNVGHTVIFKNWDGTVLKTQTVEHGSAATAPADPTRANYHFIGWDKDFSNITADTVVTAQFAIDTYTVTFKNWDGTVLKTQTVEHGSAATAPLDPTRANYHFTGWDKSFDNITADTVVTAQFAINTHTVTFKNWDGTVLKTQTVEHGSAATAPNDPTRANYHFIGWDKDFSNITADTVVTAQFAINTYTVTFKNWDGTVLKTQTVEHGSAATAPLDPTRANYHFTGWDKDFSNITADTVVTAQFAIDTYTVTFKNWDGTVLKTQTVEHGSAATSPLDPTRANYHFIGWDKDFSNITADTVVTAQFAINTHTVTFKNWDGTVLKTQTVEHGSAATAPNDPTRANYHFTGWDKSFDNITADTVVTAQFAIDTYTVTFKNWDGTVLKTQTVEHGSAATAPAEPTKENYHFTGWDKDFSNITADTVVTAQFAIDTYTVTFKNWDGTVLKTQTVEHGSAATAPAEPTRENYTFVGWDTVFDSVTSDLIITARFAENTETFTLEDEENKIEVEAGVTVIPYNVYLVVEEKDSADASNIMIEANIDADKATVFEIHLEQNGVEIQPNGTVTVRIPFPDGYNDILTRVYHIEETGEKTEIEATVEDGKLVFATDHFSTYAVVELTHIPGDINNDGTVNNKDVTCLLRYLAEWNVDVNEKALDVNGDGEKNIKDALRLLKFISDWEVEIY